MCNVSVPYWGSLYFNEKENGDSVDILSFPSPIGVLYISIVMSCIERTEQEGFPSPIGVLYISIVLRSPYNYRAAKPDCGAKPNPAFTI